jgi:hypothetical protein
MTESEINELRRQLPGLTARLASATWELLTSLDRGVKPVMSLKRTRQALEDYGAWVRRCAGPEDLAQFDAKEATQNAKLKMQNAQ